jgi:glycosyltransferase involved in cell wall biosynthesis
MGPQLITVIMPVYNERATLRGALERLLKTDLFIPFEVVVADDGSTDGSLATIRHLLDEPRIRVVRAPKNRGKGAAIRGGLRFARGDLVTILDADLEYDPADFGELLRPILEGAAEVVYGTRTFGSHTAFSFWYVVGNKLVNVWAGLLFNTWLSDVYTCYKMVPREVLRSLDLKSHDFRIEAEVTAKLLRAGHRIYEVPITYRARSREEGKKIRALDGIRAMWTLARLRFLRPPRSNLE